MDLNINYASICIVLFTEAIYTLYKWASIKLIFCPVKQLVLFIKNGLAKNVYEKCVKCLRFIENVKVNDFSDYIL